MNWLPAQECFAIWPFGHRSIAIHGIQQDLVLAERHIAGQNGVKRGLLIAFIKTGTWLSK